MKWYWRALIGIAIIAPGSIAFGFLQALYEVPALTDAQALILNAKYWAYMTLTLWVVGMLR